MYFYILYPFGLVYTSKIVEILKNKFTINKILNINVNKDELNDFLFKYLYKNEKKEHIIGKLKYITDDFSEDTFKIKIIIVKDNNEIFFNDRGTRKNKNIEYIKREIRNKFNPKFNNKNKQIFPLDEGVSHNHIIHSNDIPEEFNIIKDIIIKYKKYNIFKIDKYHHKNEFFLNYYIKKYHNKVNNIDEAEIILSASKYLNNAKLFPDKKFIFGPHFGKGRINEIKNINNKNNNNIYIQPSMPSVRLWTEELNFNTLPIKAIPFGVDTDRFKPSDNVEKNNVIVYYKQRDPNEYKLLLDFLNKKNINYRIFDYIKRYDENKFLSYLKTCKYGIVLGRHESQGFAIQEMLSCDIPLLVWGVTLRNQEYPYLNEYINIKSNVSTVPYWSDKCGELFFNYNELENKYKVFINKLDTYKPREFILENLSLEACSTKWNQLFTEL